MLIEEGEERRDKRERDDGQRNEAEHRHPARRQRSPRAILARKADCEHLKAALRQHTAIAAHRLATAGARPHGDGAASDTTRRRSAASSYLKTAGHSASLARSRLAFIPAVHPPELPARPKRTMSPSQPRAR